MTIDVKEVAQGTYQIDCGEVPVFLMSQIACWLVGESGSALLEPGCTTAAARLLDEANSLGLDTRTISYIIPTHIHVDHGGGVGYLAERLPRAKVVLNPRGAANMRDPSRIATGTGMAFGDKWEEYFGPISPVPEGQIFEVQDGESISLGNRDLTVVYTPVHATHHISILDSLIDGIYAGEALGFPSNLSPDLVLPGGIPPFDAERYLESIEKVEGYAPKRIFYSHLGFYDNPGNRLIRLVKESATAFNQIVSRAVADGLDDRAISERLVEYLKNHAEGGLDDFLLDPSGYVDYYRRRAYPSG